MTDKIKNHKWIIAVAFIIGVISVAPQLYFAFFVPEFEGIHMLGTDSEFHYLARIQEVYDGYPASGNVFSPDKDKPYLMTSLGEIIVAGFGKISSLDAVTFNVAAKFIFPFVIFLLIYAFVYKLFSSHSTSSGQAKSIAIIAACVAFFGSDLTSGLSYIIEFFSFTSSAAYFLAHTRPINPQISAIFLFVCLYILFKLVNDNKNTNLKLPLLLGLISGISIYIYIYVWSFLIILIGLYFLYYLYKRNKNYIKNFLYIIFVHAVITIPYWINFFQARMHPDYADAARRMGLVSSHEPVLGMWIIISLLAVLFFWPDEYKGVKKFLLFIIISLWIATNQQIITGVMMQQAHYHWNITKPVLVSILVGGLFIYSIQRFIKNNKLVNLFVVLSVLALVYHGAMIQVSAYKHAYPVYLERQGYSKLISYLSDNYNSPQSIFSTELTSAMLPVYTHHDAPNNAFSIYYLSSREYLSKLLFLEYKLQGVKPGVSGEIMRANRCSISKRVFGMYHREQYGSCNAIPDEFDEFIVELERQYKDFYGLSYADIFKDLNIDLVIWEKKNIPGLKQIHNINDEFVIFST